MGYCADRARDSFRAEGAGSGGGMVWVEGNGCADGSHKERGTPDKGGGNMSLWAGGQ